MLDSRPETEESDGSILCGRDGGNCVCSSWKDAHRYLQHGPAHLIAMHGRDFTSAAVLLSAGMHCTLSPDMALMDLYGSLSLLQAMDPMYLQCLLVTGMTFSTYSEES